MQINYTYSSIQKWSLVWEYIVKCKWNYLKKSLLVLNVRKCNQLPVLKFFAYKMTSVLMLHSRQYSNSWRTLFTMAHVEIVSHLIRMLYSSWILTKGIIPFHILNQKNISSCHFFVYILCHIYIHHHWQSTDCTPRTAWFCGHQKHVQSLTKELWGGEAHLLITDKKI